jgi:phosphoesterase RecJ-like protein
MHQQLYLQETPARIRLLAAALQTMELFAEGRLCVMRLSSLDFQTVGASPADTEDIVNEPLRIRDVVVSVLFVEQANGLIRVNFRSKPPLSTGDRDIDVAAIAASFGGGGHARAAGARLPGPLLAACEKVIARLKIELP